MSKVLQKDLDTNQKNMLFAWLAVSRSLFDRAKSVLQVDLIPERDNVLAFWFQSVSEYVEQYDDMPDFGVFRSMLSTNLDESLDVSGEEQTHVEHLLSMAVASANMDEAKYTRALQGMLSRYVEELHRAALSSALSKTARMDTLADQLQKAHDDLIAATATDDTLFKSAYEDDLDARPSGHFVSTGIDFIDCYCGGGGPGTTDVLGHAAPRGGGKSTILNQVACNIAIQEQTAAAKEQRQPRVVYVFNYERIEDPLIHHICYVSGVDRRSVEEFVYTKSTSHFSTSKNDYKPYELKLFQKQINRAKEGLGPWPHPEIVRIANARKILAKNLYAADFTGRKQEFSQFSGGFVEGIAKFIEMHQKHVGEPGVAAVLIDYAGTCVRTHLAKINKSSDYQRSFIEDLPLRAKRLIANRFLTFVWIAHQLAATEASKRPGTAPDKNAFKDAKSFVENVDFAVVNGMITRDGYAVFGQAKARRGDPLPDIPGRMEAWRCRWVSAGANYVIHEGAVMSRAEFQAMSGRTHKSTLEEDYE